MNINSALVGASCIKCFNSRGDSILAFKHSDHEFEPHPGETLFIFFLRIFLSFFLKKSQKNIPKMNFRAITHRSTKLSQNWHVGLVFEHFDIF